MTVNIAKINRNLDRAFPIQIASLAILFIIMGRKGAVFFIPLGLLAFGTIWRYYVSGVKYRKIQ